MKTLAIPNFVPDTGASKTRVKLRELPAVDLIAEQFVKNDKQLGRLELNASSTGESWRIESCARQSRRDVYSGRVVADELVEQRTQISLRSIHQTPENY